MFVALNHHMFPVKIIFSHVFVECREYFYLEYFLDNISYIQEPNEKLGNLISYGPGVFLKISFYFEIILDLQKSC